MLQIKKLADLGIMGIMVDKKYGGSGSDSLALSVAVEEIARYYNRYVIKKYLFTNRYFKN